MTRVYTSYDYGNSGGSFVVFYSTFNNISVILWRLTQVHFVNTKQNKQKRTKRTYFICWNRSEHHNMEL